MSIILTKRINLKAAILSAAGIACGVAGAAGANNICLPIAAILFYIAISLLILRACAVSARSHAAFFIAFICLVLTIYFIIWVLIGIDQVFYFTIIFSLAIESLAYILALIHNKIKSN